ncbi:MAG: hypothetical protein JNK90_21860 [Planctomycetaceae bacterium]|nr:hypothetical protein [Planctomycetaceae bacterium]
MLKKLLLAVVVATSLSAVGCGPKEEKTMNPEAVPQIPPSDRTGGLPGATGGPAQKGGKVAPP